MDLGGLVWLAVGHCVSPAAGAHSTMGSGAYFCGGSKSKRISLAPAQYLVLPGLKREFSCPLPAPFPQGYQLSIHPSIDQDSESPLDLQKFDASAALVALPLPVIIIPATPFRLLPP